MSSPPPPPVPIYFETSWSILSSIGLYNVFIGFLVVGITNLSPITAVPIVVSAANAIADGLCYYAFYADYPTTNAAVAAGCADFFWLVQEAGLSFYSYQILIRILGGRDRRTFIGLFWVLILFITTFRSVICVSRVQDIMENSDSRQVIIDHMHIGYFTSIALVEILSSYFLLQKFFDHMHIGYFTSIALVEILSSYFLLQKFFSAQASSTELNSKLGLFKYLTRSTEIRLAVLTLIGITRAITYSFQTTAQSATSISGQVDRFVATLECLFPVVMFIDILAAKSLLSGTNRQYCLSQSRSHGQDKKRRSYIGPGATQGVYSMANIETRVAANALSSSQERIVGSSCCGPGDESIEGEGKAGGINKTVEFALHESECPV